MAQKWVKFLNLNFITFQQKKQGFFVHIQLNKRISKICKMTCIKVVEIYIFFNIDPGKILW